MIRSQRAIHYDQDYKKSNMEINLSKIIHLDRSYKDKL